ncbi:MAG: methyl-accepting chemotaxis protein [Pseudomonadales bacterium]|nr:methyl-accepting chemotaxis protein [Pseudomonadales bacterium]
MSESLKEIAEGDGDISRRLESKNKDEVGKLSSWFNIFADKLHKTISEVVSFIRPLSDVSTQLAEVSEETATASADVIRSTEEVTVAMNEMSLAVTEVAQHAGLAATSAKEANHEAVMGQKVVFQTVDAITILAKDIESAGAMVNQLDKDAENVGGILDVIKSIAEQTNLLALNAAIEAARAGDQGRGFAVVADEVRTLAVRTQDATGEIHTVIQELQKAATSAVTAMKESTTNAQHAVGQVSRTGESLNAITEKVIAITQLNSSIATSTEEQSYTVTQIQQNVEVMAVSAKLSAAATEKVIELSKSIGKISSQLEEVGGQFKL